MRGGCQLRERERGTRPLDAVPRETSDQSPIAAERPGRRIRSHESRLAITELLTGGRGIFVKLTHLSLIGAFALVGVAQAGEDRAVAKACKADAEHMCSGKTGQALEQCLKSNQAQLSANCKEAVSKLPGKS